jgi:hypothetical protein
MSQNLALIIVSAIILALNPKSIELKSKGNGQNNDQGLLLQVNSTVYTAFL